MVLAVAPGVEVVASAVVASETDINSLIIQIHSDGLRFADATRQQVHAQQTTPHHQAHQFGIRSAGSNGPLHNEVLQLAELLVFLDRQLARFVRIPYELNPTITDSTHDTILFLLSLPSPHLAPSMPSHHDFVILSQHFVKVKDCSISLPKKDDVDIHRAKSADTINRRASFFQTTDLTEPLPAIESVLTSWGSVCKSGAGVGIVTAWKFASRIGGSVSPSDESRGCVDGVTVLVCIRARVLPGIIQFDAFGFNCSKCLIKAESDSGAPSFF
jgi:hypothetical protein